jgi:hypothetical protein
MSLEDEDIHPDKKGSSDSRWNCLFLGVNIAACEAPELIH